MCRSASFSHCHRSHSHHTYTHTHSFVTQRSVFFFHFVLSVCAVCGSLFFRYSFDSSVCLSPDPKCLFIRNEIFYRKRQRKKRRRMRKQNKNNDTLNRTGNIVRRPFVRMRYCRIYMYLFPFIWFRLGQTNWMSKWMVMCVLCAVCVVCVFDTFGYVSSFQNEKEYKTEFRWNVFVI